MSTVVVTGCAGLLGSHLSRYLIKNGYKVLGIDNLSGGYQEYLPETNSDTFDFYNIDLVCETKAIKEIFKQNPVACFHFAAYAAEGLSPFIRRYNYSNNIIASANVINECINTDTKIIFASSMAVYGCEHPPFDEEMRPSPIDPYGIAKYAVEMDLKVAQQQHGLQYSIVRPHNIVGIYQNIWDKYRNVAGIFIRKVLDKEPILIYGDGEQTRAFSDVKYYMKPFVDLIANHNGQTFNIGADKAYTINQLADIVLNVAKKYGYYTTVQRAEPRHEAKYAHCDHTKAKEILDFCDKTNLNNLIEEMFVWAMNQPKREQKHMRYEIEKGMYDYWVLK